MRHDRESTYPFEDVDAALRAASTPSATDKVVVTFD